MINLLPWRPLVKHYRQKMKRRLFWIGIAVFLMLISISVIGSHTLEKPSPLPATLATPSTPSPTRPETFAQRNANSLYQEFLALQHLLTKTPALPLYLSRLILTENNVLISGKTDSQADWLNWIRNIQKNKQWTLHITHLERKPPHQTLYFGVNLTLLTPPSENSPNESLASSHLREVKNHAVILKKLFQASQNAFSLDALDWPETEDQAVTLRASGDFKSLILITESVFQKNFFAPFHILNLKKKMNYCT